MGCALGKFDTNPCENSTDLKEKMRVLENEMMMMRCKREQDRGAREQMVHGLMAKELEWKRERKRWKEETAAMRMRLEEKDESMRRLEKEAAMAAVAKGDKEWWQGLRASFLVQHMREEHARRDEAVEKWKRLYLAIKTELDDLIFMTRQGESLWSEAEEEEEEEMEALKKKLKTKEETIEALRKQISAMAKEGADRERQVDILRQSLRILSKAKQAKFSNNLCTCETKSDKIKTYVA